MATLTMSVREAAEALGASTTAVRRWIKSGELPAVRIGGRIFITHDGLRKRHVWRGLVRASALENPGEIEPYRLPSNDNDGLWTALYVAAESFRYAATGDEDAKRNASARRRRTTRTLPHPLPKEMPGVMQLHHSLWKPSNST